MDNDNNDDYKDFEPLSNFDIMKIMFRELKERANIIDTRNMNMYNNFNDLWKDKGHCILFEMPDPNAQIGHWTCLVRQKKNNNHPKETCIYFDSYGDKLGNEKIKKLLREKYNIIQYNPDRLQEYDSNLCGVYALLGVMLNKIIPNLNVKQMLSFFHQKGRNEKFDDFVYELSKEM